MRQPLLSVMALLLAGILVGPPPGADASSELHTWMGTVTHVADGDTFDVDIDGDGTSEAKRVRMTGIQAMETGECHSMRAERRLRKLIQGKRVRLSAVDPASTASRSRLLRFVEVKRDGRWVDVNLAMLRGGHALWLPHPVESIKHEQYHRVVSEAMERGRRLWDDDLCDPGPYPRMKLDMWVQSDADGNDFQNVNGEWVKLRNRSKTVTVKIGGWVLRDAGQRGYRFPAGTSIAPRQTLTVHVGEGSDADLRRYMGRSQPLFQNIYEFEGHTGDGIYLFDKDGDLRKHFTYACYLNCSDRLQGALELKVNYDADGVDQDNPNGEWVDVINRSTSRASLYGYLIESPPYSYEFPPNTWVEPGERLRVRIGRGTNSTGTHYWGHASSILNNEGDHVELRTFDYIRLDCDQWGSRTCPRLLSTGTG